MFEGNALGFSRLMVEEGGIRSWTLYNDNSHHPVIFETGE
jgi:hypothetical protein